MFHFTKRKGYERFRFVKTKEKTQVWWIFEAGCDEFCTKCRLITADRDVGMEKAAFLVIKYSLGCIFCTKCILREIFFEKIEFFKNFLLTTRRICAIVKTQRPKGVKRNIGVSYYIDCNEVLRPF